MPELQKTLEEIGREIEEIGRAMQEATIDINKATTFGYRLAVVKRVAKQLGDPTERITSFGNEFASQLHDVDEGFRAIIDRALEELEENPDYREYVCNFFRMVRSLSAAAQIGLGSVQQMIDSISPIEKMSRDLRPVLRRLRKGLTTMVEAREISDSWVGLIESCGVDCSAYDTDDG